MSKRSDDSGRPPAGGTVGDDAALSTPPAPVPFAKTELFGSRAATPVPVGHGDLPTIDQSQYAVSGELARGGLGRILRARHRYLDRIVAIKEGLRGDDPAQARFIREALVTARLQHPSIVPVYEAGRWPTGEPFYAMKLVSGRSLSTVIDETSEVEERLALLPNVIAVADAMAYAHGEHIIHRDLKPDNILVGAFGETVVIDWGLAKDLSATHDDDIFDSPYQIAAQGLTMAGAIMGTPEYMAPEQAEGKAVDERSDVYSIGCILYHVLVGDAPFRGKSAEDIITKVLAHVPAALEERVTGIPADLASIVRKAMARDPKHRYPTAKELAEDLRRFQTGQLVSSKQYTAWQLVMRWARRHRTVLAVVAAAVVVSIAIGTVAVTNVVRERAVARAAQATAEARTNELILVQARSALAHDPAEAIAWLKSYPPTAPGWSEAREIAMQADVLEPARHILEHQNARMIAFSSDGARLASAGRDREVRVWNVASGARMRTVLVPADVVEPALASDVLAVLDVQGHVYLARDGKPATRLPYEAQTRMRLSRDGRLIASGGRDGTVHLVDTQSTVDRPLRLTHEVNALAFTQDTSMLAAADDQRVQVLDLRSGRLQQVNGGALALAVSPDGALVAAATRDKMVRVTQLKTGATTDLHTEDVAFRLEFSTDGKRLVSLDDRKLVVWDAATGRQVRALACDPNAALSADGASVMFGAPDGKLRVIDLVTGDIRPLRGKQSLVVLAMSPDGRRVAAIGADFRIHVWSLRGELSRTLRGHTDQLRNAAFSRDGRLFATASANGEIGLWSSADGDNTMLRGHQDAVFDVMFSPDGKLLASASIDKTARVWTLATGASRVARDYSGAVWHPTFSKDGRSLFTMAQDGTFRRWDLDSDQSKIGKLAGAGNLDVSPDGRSIVTVDPSGAIRLWDVATWSHRLVASQRGDIGEARFLPDGRHLVSRAGIAAGNDRTVRLWDITSATSRVLFTATATLRALAISPDGQRIAVGGQDRVIRVIDLTNGAIRQLQGHTDTVKALRFSPDGRLLASGSFDRTVRLWELATGATQIAHLHDGPVWDVQFSPDGKLLASTSTDTTAWLGAVDATRGMPSDANLLRARIDDITTVTIGADNWARTP